MRKGYKLEVTNPDTFEIIDTHKYFETKEEAKTALVLCKFYIRDRAIVGEIIKEEFNDKDLFIHELIK